MSSVPIGRVASQVARLYGEGTVSGLSESQLLDRFLARNDAVAFEALVARHGPMVLAVCRRVLRDSHAAEDAFQATFLLLVRKAHTIRGTDLLGPWLHRVAYRIAVRASKADSRRKSKETPAAEAVALAEAPESPGAELRLAMHEALDGLPEKYRAPVVLCYLEGRTHDEAARRLDWPIGSVKGRLARARAILKDRLSRKGVLVPSAAILAGLAGESSAAVPVALRESTIRAASSLAAGKTLLASGATSASAALLAREAAKSMLLKKLATLAASAAALFLIVGGAAVVARQDGGKSIEAKAPEAKSGVKAEDAKVAETKAGEPESDLDRLQGTWDRVLLVASPKGNQILITNTPPSLGQITIRKDTFFGVGDDGEPAYPRTITLDPSKSPKEFTWRRIAAGGAEEVTRGIYRIDESTLSLCFDPRSPAKPPTDFGDPSRSPDALYSVHSLVYRRAAAIPEPTAESVDELRRLQGEWNAVASERDGQEQRLQGCLSHEVRREQGLVPSTRPRGFERTLLPPRSRLDAACHGLASLPSRVWKSPERGGRFAKVR